jgi:hypothetical protein
MIIWSHSRFAKVRAAYFVEAEGFEIVDRCTNVERGNSSDALECRARTEARQRGMACLKINLNGLTQC